jgi:YHS domain-containing protein
MSLVGRVVVGLGVLAALLGGGVGQTAQEEVATCPVDGKSFAARTAARVVSVGDLQFRFCSGACLQTFAANPEKFLTGTYQCPVFTNRRSKPSRDTRFVVNNNLYYLCCAACNDEFPRDPAAFLKSLNDPVSGAPFTPAPNGSSVRVGDQVYLFASDETRQAFEKDPERYVVRYR